VDVRYGSLGDMLQREDVLCGSLGDMLQREDVLCGSLGDMTRLENAFLHLGSVIILRRKDTCLYKQSIFSVIKHTVGRLNDLSLYSFSLVRRGCYLNLLKYRACPKWNDFMDKFSYFPMNRHFNVTFALIKSSICGILRFRCTVFSDFLHFFVRS
jgi:hypothetical protein